MLLCLVVPILANGLRAYGIILLAHLTDHALAIYIDHIVYGFIFLSLVLLILIGLGALFREQFRDDAPAPRRTQKLRGLSSSLSAFLLEAALLGDRKSNGSNTSH